MTDELSGSKSIIQKCEMQTGVIRIKVLVTIFIQEPCQALVSIKKHCKIKLQILAERMMRRKAQLHIWAKNL